MENLKRLCRKLNYEFKDLKLLKRALTHCSAAAENNERFEFLGDAILSFAIASALFERFPEESEGELSRLRSFLVKGDRLADIAMELNLGDFLYLGQGELKTGGFRRASILADALEAVIAAVFLDGGIEASLGLISRLYQSRLEAKDVLKYNLKDAKTQLQEFLQAKKWPLPEYTLVKFEGEEHEQIFHVSCSVAGFERSTLGLGSNRRRAEQEAAESLLRLLKDGE